MKTIFIVLIIHHLVLLADQLTNLLTGHYIDVLFLYYALFWYPGLALTFFALLWFLYRKRWSYVATLAPIVLATALVNYLAIGYVQ